MTMNNPARFDKLTITKEGIKAFIDIAKNKLNWNAVENVLDIGCGPGSVTAKFLPPVLPNNTSIVGIDISEKMVEFAKKNYSSDNISYKTMDICDENIMSFLGKDEFSKIFSFYCFHRIDNKRKALENVYYMLKPGGEFIVQLIIDCYWYRAHKYLLQNEKYKIYEKQLLSVIPHEDFTDRIIKLLQNIGFELIYSEKLKKKTKFSTRTNLYEFFEIISFLPNLVPQDVVEDIMIEIKTVETERELLDDVDQGFFYNHSIFSFVARKPL